MPRADFPDLRLSDVSATRAALHAYSKILGGLLKHYRSRRKHWWHISLRPSLYGLSTGPVRTKDDFEADLDLRVSALHMRMLSGDRAEIPLTGQPASDVWAQVRDFLGGRVSDVEKLPAPVDGTEKAFDGYSRDNASLLGRVIGTVAASLEVFRNSIREETSPVQLWPHHFDVAMLWLPGEKIPGQDPANEEYADKQMNFGFTFGDATIPEPYFYVTAYPQPSAFPELQLPEGAVWHESGFSGVVLPYAELAGRPDGGAFLLNLWQTLLAAGREHLPATNG